MEREERNNIGINNNSLEWLARVPEVWISSVLEQDLGNTRSTEAGGVVETTAPLA